MKSKVRIAGHPLHPMLVGYPVAFYTATLVCFIVFASTRNAYWFRTAVYMNAAGVLLALLAALPGFIDFFKVIPGRTLANRTGLLHMAFNLAALILFSINLFVQWTSRTETVPDLGPSIALSAFGMLFTLLAGFLGWKLVQKHHVGVDLRAEQEWYDQKSEQISDDRENRKAA